MALVMEFRLQPRTFAGWGTAAKDHRCLLMEPDLFDVAIEEILASADGDVRRALRAVLVETFLLQARLRQLEAVSEDGKAAEVLTVH
jgi:hypothetical protein